MYSYIIYIITRYKMYLYVIKEIGRVCYHIENMEDVVNYNDDDSTTRRHVNKLASYVHCTLYTVHCTVYSVHGTLIVSSSLCNI